MILLLLFFFLNEASSQAHTRAWDKVPFRALKPGRQRLADAQPGGRQSSAVQMEGAHPLAVLPLGFWKVAGGGHSRWKGRCSASQKSNSGFWQEEGGVPPPQQGRAAGQGVIEQLT